LQIKFIAIFSGNNNTPAHISINEFGSADFTSFTNKKYGVWASNNPNVASVGKCIGGFKGRMVSVNCSEKLPFVCEL
jgi:hypothetical protein